MSNAQKTLNSLKALAKTDANVAEDLAFAMEALAASPVAGLDADEQADFIVLEMTDCIDFLTEEMGIEL